MNNGKTKNILTKLGNRFLISDFPLLELPLMGKNFFALNPYLPDDENRCRLNCSYCISQKDSWNQRHKHFNNLILPTNISEILIEYIMATPSGRKGFPIALFDLTDPFLTIHWDRLITCISLLAQRNAINIIYITTKVHPGLKFLERLKNSFSNSQLKPIVLVSLSPLQPGLEAVSVSARIKLIKDLVMLKIPCCWYIRPLVPEWTNMNLLNELAIEIIPVIKKNIIISGLIMTKEIEKKMLSEKLIIPAWNRSKPGTKLLLPEWFEKMVKAEFINIGSQLGIDIGSVLSHRICGANRYLEWGCKLCKKPDRFCQGIKQ